MKQTILSILIALVSTTTAYAYDFEANGIYYNILSNGDGVKVTYKSYGDTSYSGTIDIPATVNYNDNTYSVTAIGFEAFSNCSGLTSVTIPNSVTSIDVWAFSGCNGLTGALTIPNSVTSIGDCAFSVCSSLTSITISNSLTKLSDWIFFGCKGLTSIAIPNSVTYIGQQAFYGCSGLTSVSIPNSVTFIGISAFECATQVTEVSLGESVAYIETSAFKGMENLVKVTSLSTTPPECADASVFDAEVYESATLYVPEGSKADYESAFVWQDFSKIEGISDSGVDDAAADALGISTADGAISVAGSDAPMQVYDLSGKRVWQGPASQGARLARGIYLVRVSDTVTKVAL